MSDVIKIVSVFLWSGLKFMLGIAQAILFDLGFIPSVILTVLGGMAGVFFFALLDKHLLYLWRKLFRIKPRLSIKFTKRKRWLVRVKNKYGLAGIAFLTPLLLQVPIGTIIAMRLMKDIRKVSLYMFISFTFFSILCCGTYYFGIGHHYREAVAHILHKH